MPPPASGALRPSIRTIGLRVFRAFPRLGFTALWGENGIGGCKLAADGGVYQIDGSRYSRKADDRTSGGGDSRARVCVHRRKPPAANLPLPAGFAPGCGSGRDVDAGMFPEGAPQLEPFSRRFQRDDLADADRDQFAEGPLAQPALAVLAAHAG